MVARSGGHGRTVREAGTNMYTLLYPQWIASKDPLYAQGTLLTVRWQPGWEGVGERMDTRM